MINRLNLQESPQELSKQVTAEAKPDTVVLSITVKDPKPSRAQFLADTFSEEFAGYVEELEPPTESRPSRSKHPSSTEPKSPVAPYHPTQSTFPSPQS